MICCSFAGYVSTYEWTIFEDISEYFPSSIALGILPGITIELKSEGA